MDDEVVFRVSEAEPEVLERVGLQELGYWERRDLQRWVEEHPEIVGPDLLLVTTEFDRWQFGERRVADRLDLLFLTSDGAPLVAELKRGHAPDTVDVQALKYAAYCSQLTVEQLVRAYADHHEASPEEARAEVLEHAPALGESELGAVRVRLVAEGFGPSVTTTVMWMNQQLGLDIGCVRITARRLPDGSAVVASRLIVPPPAARDYLVGVRNREREEERLREASSLVRRPNAVPRLIAADAVTAGTILKLRLSAFIPKERRLLEPFLRDDELAGAAEWVGRTPNQALRWRKDGKLYSASKLAVRIMQACGARPEPDGGSAPGPSLWESPNGLTLWELAESLEGPERDGGAR